MSSNIAVGEDGERRSTLRSALLSHYDDAAAAADDDDDDDADYDDDIVPCIDEDGNIVEEAGSFPYHPPGRASSSSGFSKLEDPLSLREALWSSTVPRETLDDIKRLGVVTGVGGLGQGHRGGGVGLGYGGGVNISLTSLYNAESI